MKTYQTLRTKAIELSRELTALSPELTTAKEYYNEAVNSIENPAYLAPDEFYRRIYNYLINKKNNL